VKYIVVTGGVLSGLGKGTIASSIGRLLIARGLKVTAIKIDPYLNTDAGTMNPYQHGEVFVLDDGGEVDLDLGNYERFLNLSLSREHNITTGKVYAEVIRKERLGEYLGKTVQIIPHVTNEIKERMARTATAAGAEVAIVEIGGTVGDIESMPFLEAARQLRREVGGEQNCLYVHVTLVPKMSVVGEPKTKPTQHSVKQLREIGIQPDVIVARTSEPLDYEIRKKISLFCDVPLEAVVSSQDAGSIYQVPLLLEEQGLTDYLVRKMGMEPRTADLGVWTRFVDALVNAEEEVEIALVGKYTHLHDSYLSYIETFHHCSARLRARVKINWIEGEDLEKAAPAAVKALKGSDGVLIPGGFGRRGIEGKIIAIEHSRTTGVPLLGVCLGFQLCTIEFARHVLALAGANSTEFEPECPHPVVSLLPEQKTVQEMGATMRLGAQPVLVSEGSIAHSIYSSTMVLERHRHRFEVNPEYIERFHEAGLRFTGRSEDGRRMEVLELKGHTFFVASQFHPEFRSRPESPAPLYLAFVKAALEHARGVGGERVATKVGAGADAKIPPDSGSAGAKTVA
jgi:CTP synthase